MIAREFNFSETVFLHGRKDDGSFPISIFTPVNEMELAGHPVIGTGHVLFRSLLPGVSAGGQTKLTLLTKAGPVGVSYDTDGQTVSAEIPHNIHLHSVGTPKENLVKTQPSWAVSAEFPSMKPSYPAVSVVKGVTYTLVDFTEQPQLFASVSASESQVTELDEGWGPSFISTMYYRVQDAHVEGSKRVQNLRVRMIAINLEDPACGSGNCALSAYLALQHGDKNGEYRFVCDQGSEIGRDSKIIVDVVLNELGTGVSTILLSGEAAPVAEGVLLLPE